jgi:hypothetical protein
LRGGTGLVAAAVVGGCLLGCAHPPPPKVVAPPAEPLHLSPLVDLAPAAALAWLIEVRPRSLFLDRRVAGAIAGMLPENRLLAFKGATGGVDPREIGDLVIAAYPSTVLWLVQQFVDPRRIEAAFKARVVTLEGRAEDAISSDPRSSITRLWGAGGTDRLDVAIFGVEAVGLEQGRFGPLRAAELFAEGRLKRASPALRVEPLAHLAKLLDEAPLRAFAPGPFQGELQPALGGLLGVSTAVGATARVVDASASSSAGLAVRAVLMGAWNADADAASDRLRAVFDILAQSGIGRLLGLGHCLAGPVVHGSEDALTLDFTVDAAELARGLNAATLADARTIMAP